MKRKYSIVRVATGIIIIILCISALFGSPESRRLLLPYMLICLGVFQVSNGMHFYKLGKKPDGIILILSSVFIFLVAIKIIIM